MICIKVVAIGVTHYDSAQKEANHLAEKLGIAIELCFNGTTHLFYPPPNSDPENRAELSKLDSCLLRLDQRDSALNRIRGIIEEVIYK